MNKNISKYAFYFLRWFCPSHLYEEIEGDLIQKFQRDVVQVGEAKAERRLVWNVLRFLRPGIVFRNKISLVFNPFLLAEHFLKVFYRNTLKQKRYSIITISGLVTGMTAFALISIYVLNERSYDNFHSKGDRIFRIRQDRYTGKELTRQWTAGPWGIGPDLKNNFPEVIRYVSVNRGGMRSTVLSNRDIFFEEDKVFYASEEFFRLFSFPLIQGTDSLVLTRPFTMVVSASLAKRYFGEENPVGKTLRNNGKEEYEITGVFKDTPQNTHLKFEALLSYKSLLAIIGPAQAEDLMSNWAWSGNYTYIELASMADAETLEAKLPVFVEKKAGAFLKEWGEAMSFVLQPVSSIHLRSNFKDEVAPNGDAASVNFLALIAVFILIMAWINYVNLATAKALDRAREVGVRKILGSSRAQLIRQFLFESALIKFAALVITVTLVALLLPQFSYFIDTQIILLDLISYQVLLAIAGIFLTGVFLSGLYPAFVLSGFKPAHILKGFHGSLHGGYLRRGLVTVQFISSVVLIAGTMIVFDQIEFMRGKALGIDIEEVLIIHGPMVRDSTYAKRFESFRTQLLEYSEVAEFSASSDVPGRSVTSSNGGVRLVGQDPKLGNSFRVIMSDEDFTDTYGMKLLTGRSFSRDFTEHWRTALVNEAAMKRLGFSDPEKIIGQRIYVWDSALEIVGVLKDYHQESLKRNIDQLIFVCDKETLDYYSIKIKTSNASGDVVKLVESQYNKAFPGNPFRYFFADDYFNRQYQSEQRFAKIFGLFSVLAVSIACLGLLGLSSFLVAQRTKEIGIRKVLGASVNTILFLLTRDFLFIVVVAFGVAAPVTYYIMNSWLQNFAYHINIGWSVFVLSGATLLIATLFTVSIETLRAAMANPLKSLRSE